MREKKLLTFACVVAILAFGACSTYFPSQPLPPFLALVHTIAVQVQDDSGEDPVDTKTMTRALASHLNQLWKGHSVFAEAAQPSRQNDANLKIVVLRKALSCAPYSRHTEHRLLCTFDLTTSSTLTGSGDRPLWARTGTHEATFFREKTLPPHPWELKPVADDIGSYLAAELDGDVRFGTSQ